MLEGREISVLMLSELLKDSDFRNDAELYSSLHLQVIDTLSKNKHQTIKGTIFRGSQPIYADKGILVVKSAQVSKGFPKTDSGEFVSEEFANQNFSSIINCNDVLVNGTGRGTLGRCSIYLGQEKLFADGHVTIFRNLDVLPAFLYAFLNTKYGQIQIEARQRGSSGQLEIYPKDFEKMFIPILPQAFQTEIEKIVKKAHSCLEQSKTLYTEAENLLLESLGLANFDKVQNFVKVENHNIKTFSSSFLSTGRLDAEYYQPKYEVLENKIKSYEGGFCRLKDLTLSYSSGFPFENNNYSDEGFSLIRINNIKKGSLELDNAVKVPLSDVAKSTKDIVKENDILISMSGTIGNSCKIPKGIEAIINQRILKITPQNYDFDVLPLLINSIIGQMQLERVGTGGVQTNLTGSDILNILIPILPQETQTLISSKIQESFRLKSESEALLSLAKEVVEIAIEISEEKALQKIQDMTQKIYVLPAKIDLHYFSNLLLAIETQQAPKITLDWSSCVSIDKQSYCSILHLRDIIAIKNAELSHLGEDTITYQKVKHIFEYDLNNNSDIFSGIFISPIQSEELILQHQRLMENFYSKHTKGYDLTSLGNIFQELYMNVCQHSEVSKGYIFMANPDENGNCEMIFSDKGIGIVDKICNFFVDETFETDAKVIEYATQKGVTTRSQTQNQGKGLDNLVVQAESLKASLCIYSKQGIFKKIIKDITLLDNPLLYKGTLIYLSFNICNLPLQEDDNLVGEL